MSEILHHYPSFMIYLAGPVDFVKDRGTGYREAIKKKLKKIGINPTMVLDPCSKPVQSDVFKDFDTEAEYYQTLKKHGHWDKLEEMMQMTMHVDLRFVDKSDLVLAVVKPEIPMCGTWHEIVEARHQKKPVILIDPRGKEGTSLWALGLVGHKRIFKTDDEAIDYLNDVLQKKIDVDMREWLFLHLKNGKKN